MATMEQGVSSDARLSKFFKVYFPRESGNDLELPTFFNSSLPKTLPRTVTVSSIYGKKWKLALRKCSVDDENEKCLLVNGWKRIVKEEGVTGGDFLEFEFDGSTSFNFCIYKGDTLCKRLRPSSVASHEDSDDDNVIVLTSDDDDDESNDVDYNDADDIESIDDSVEDVEAVKDDDDVNDDDDEYRQYLDDCNNPSFHMTLNPKKKSQLHIPAQVIKDYGLNFSESITVVDPLAQKFGSLEKKIKIQVNGSVFIKGFGSVIRRNNVKVTDKMVCELKKTGNNLVHTIKVYVING